MRCSKLGTLVPTESFGVEIAVCGYTVVQDGTGDRNTHTVPHVSFQLGPTVRAVDPQNGIPVIEVVGAYVIFGGKQTAIVPANCLRVFVAIAGNTVRLRRRWNSSSACARGCLAGCRSTCGCGGNDAAERDA